MDKTFENRCISIKLNIAYYRKKAGLSQEYLAEKIHISRTHMSYIEAPNVKTVASLQVLHDIANALDIDMAKLLEIR